MSSKILSLNSRGFSKRFHDYLIDSFVTFSVFRKRRLLILNFSAFSLVPGVDLVFGPLLQANKVVSLLAFLNLFFRQCQSVKERHVGEGC